MNDKNIIRSQQLFDAIDCFADAKVLVVGDITLDRFVYGEIKRISPEAPVPVLVGDRENQMLGGCGNVVANIAALGGMPVPVTAVGDDANGQSVIRMLTQQGVKTESVIICGDRPTSCKTRFIALNQQVLRFDKEEVKPLSERDRHELIRLVGQHLKEINVVVVSDYGKGVLIDGVAREIIDLARGASKPVFVDPKNSDYSVYRFATAVTPNRNELSEAVSREVNSDSEVEIAGRELIAKHDLEIVVATRSEKGMSIVSESVTHHIPTEARDVFDVSGAGDTVIAALALARAAGLNWVTAAQFANAAAGVVVGKRGTAQAKAKEVMAMLSLTQGSVGSAPGIMSWEDAAEIASSWRAHNLKIGFTNGCFDLLHSGHVTLLQEARRRCDRLIIGLNSDDSVRRLKGPERPINKELDRAFVLSSLACVDAVVLFPQDTPLELLEIIRPDVLLKGADYGINEVVGADFVQGYGGEVSLIDLVEGRSTTGTIGRIRQEEAPRTIKDMS